MQCLGTPWIVMPGGSAPRESTRDASRLRIAALLPLLAIALPTAVFWPSASNGQSSSASYLITRHTVDGGGNSAASASFSLTGSVGQADAGPEMTSASFRLRGGFHRADGESPTPHAMFSDGFETLQGRSEQVHPGLVSPPRVRHMSGLDFAKSIASAVDPRDGHPWPAEPLACAEVP